MIDRSRTRSALGIVVALLALLALASCSKGTDVAGTYVHTDEGTITLSSDGNGSWKQSGEPSTFTWSGDADNLSFKLESGKTGTGVKIVDGNLVIPANMISGDNPVTFTRK